MKTSTLTFLTVVVFCYSTHAQKFTILPLVGVENSVTKIGYNDLSSFNPLQSQLSSSLGLRMDYKLMKGQGPFVGITTTRPTVLYSINDAATGMADYTASVGNLQMQLQAGWQASTKRIYFKKLAAPTRVITQHHQQVRYGRCGSYRYMGHSGDESKRIAYKAPENKSWFVRIMPSAGIAYNPLRQDDVTNKMEGGRNTLTYNAGNFKTALLTGVGFEFGNNAKRHFTLNLNYFNGLGTNAESITTVTGGKTNTANLTSKVSGWNASIGIPISLGKKPVVKQLEKKKCEFKGYKSSCRRVI